MFLTGLIVFIIGIAIMVAICRVALFVLELSVVFSKVSVAMVIAAAFNASVTLVSNGFMNYIIWVAICIAGCFLLCRLPRIDCALEFFSKALVSYAVGLLLINILLTAILKIDLTLGWQIAVEIGVKLTVLAISAGSLYQRLMEVDITRFSNVIVVTLERLVASLLYGFACGTIAVGNLPVAVADWVSTVVLLGAIVLAFVADCVLTRK